MQCVRKTVLTAALSTGFVMTMVASAPTAFAATPTPAANTVASHQVSYEASSVAIRPADTKDYEHGYRHGYQEGFADGKVACRNHANARRGGDTERGYADGYQAGFKAGDELCRD
jgi:flagellar biosynthesis/type III secretory pathway protein FliH